MRAGRYNFRRSFWHNVLFYQATNRERYMSFAEHQAITNVIATRSAFKLTLGALVVMFLWWVRHA